ncbi:MAG TPA: hypothetical protein VE422_35985 [Terriglobia bacterium]|nr:hypothetical protein [Terriglobia bacterium]
MPNGFYGSQEQWQRLEQAFLEWEEIFDRFARAKTVQVIRNAHGWPSRSLEWIHQSIQRKIEVVANDVPSETFNVWTYAWKDVGDKRFSKVTSVGTNLSKATLAKRLTDILDEAWAQVNAWSDNDLSSVTDIKLPNR